MSSSDFLKEMLEAGERESDKPISKTIAKVKFEMGFSGFCTGHSMTSLFRVMTEPEKSGEVKNAVSDHIKSLGGRGGAVIGLRYTVPAESIISFEADFGKERFVQRFGDEADFEQIWKAIDELGIEVNAWQWVAYTTVDSPTAVAKGEDGKFTTQSGDKVYPKIIVPVEKFADEAAARAAAGNSGASNNSQWSSKALNEYPGGVPEEIQDQVHYWYNEILKGTAFANNPEGFPLPYQPNDPVGAKKRAVKLFLAEQYYFEVDDIDVIESLKTPF